MAKKQAASPATPKIRDRIKELRRVKASDLVPNERNWRLHPDAQRTALMGVLEEIGYADALVARELPDGRLKLIDGHLRASATPDADVPVIVVDLNEDEEKLLLATFDPLAAAAETDDAKLKELLGELNVYDGRLAKFLDNLNPATAEEVQTPEEEIGDHGPGKYPISPVFMEKYDYVVIMASNAMDFSWLQTVLEIQPEENYKNSYVGIGRVVPVKKFRDLWEAREKKP